MNYCFTNLPTNCSTFLYYVDAVTSLEEVRRRYWLRLNEAFPIVRDWNPLPILARAVNALSLSCRIIHQPCWKAGRFKSKT